MRKACYAAGARETQVVTSLTQHCHRQLEQFVLSNPVLPLHPGELVSPNLDPRPRPDSHNGCQVLPDLGPNPGPDSHHEARVRVGLQLPALLALCLALPHWTSTVRSLKGKTCKAVVSLKLCHAFHTYAVTLCDAPLPSHHTQGHCVFVGAGLLCVQLTIRQQPGHNTYIKLALQPVCDV